jgi:serine/threonine protein kinase
MYTYIGLDYLHKGCSPPIIHRDVKSGNILLGQNMRAKMADLGLSKTYLNEAQTHVSATAAGTAGYMDPQYVPPSIRVSFYFLYSTKKRGILCVNQEAYEFSKPHERK